ncbi:MAG: hypothetical protein J6A36_04315 [Clostridia bacterium]|nr:hypothetical protein [Clostridia bacterium]
MINIVIISKDFDYSRYLINFLNSKNNNLRVAGLLTELEELYDVSKSTTIDIILINSDSIDYKILEENKMLQFYLKSTIVISNQHLINSKENLDVYAFIEIQNDMETISNIVNKLATTKIIEKSFYSSLTRNNAVVKAIENELKYLNVTISYRGVTYLIDTIYIAYNLENDCNINLETDIYPIIAEKYHKKISNIKSNISYAVNMLYIECEEKKLLEYLGEYSLYKPSPKRIVFAILYNVKNKLNNSIKV